MPIVRKGFALLALLFAACIVTQVFFAGLGTFSGPDGWELHRTLVQYFVFLPLIMFILSWFGRIRGGTRWMCLAAFAVIVMQFLTVNVWSGIGYVAAIHTVDALLLFWIALYMVRKSLPWLRTPAADRSAAVDG